MSATRVVRQGSVSERRFLGVAALLFAASAIGTAVWCGSMGPDDSARMDMPGGWTMSMAWMRMPGQSWPGAAATFVGMWSVMMVAMMLPSLVPTLIRYRGAVATAGEQGTRLSIIAGLGYFCVWTLLGAGVYPLGVGLGSLMMRLPGLAHGVPLASGAIMTIAGGLQFTAWKSRRLACCRQMAQRDADLAPDGISAWRYGLRVGRQCVGCCAGLTATLLALGVMDLRPMALVTAAISLERLAPAGEWCARIVGAVLVGTGLFAIAHSAS